MCRIISATLKALRKSSYTLSPETLLRRRTQVTTESGMSYAAAITQMLLRHELNGLLGRLE